MSKSESKDNLIILNPIGIIKGIEEEQRYWIEIHKQYRPALKELGNFTHCHIIWWANENDTKERREVLVSETLPPFYGNNVPSMGVFANRSEFRPNPIAITICPIISVDENKGIITIPWIDAYLETPVIDIKPYIPMADLVKSAECPEYLQHWPKNVEAAIKWWSEQVED
jgi:tRNA-Thr(GGU) m(6)t(6)A37 methyltransferase TsaA